MGCVDTKQLHENFMKMADLFAKTKRDNDILLEDLIKCSEANNDMMKILKSMKEFLENQLNGSYEVENWRDENGVENCEWEKEN